MALPANAFEDDALNMTSRLFWNNELIWKEMKSYLNWDDLFALAATNKYFRLKILDGLTEMAVLTIKDESNFRLETITKLYNVSTLVIRNRGKLSEDIIISGLIKIISHCRNLKGLVFDTHELFEKKYAPLFQNPDVKYRLTKLKLLEIGRFRRAEGDEQCNIENCQYVLATFNFLKNTGFVPTYEFLPDIDMQLESFYYQEPNASVQTTLFQPELLLCTSMCSLRSLSLVVNNDGFKKLQKLQFLRLEKLELTISICWNQTVQGNENIPEQNAVNDEEENLVNENLINNEANAPEVVVIYPGNIEDNNDDESGSDHEEDAMSDSDEDDFEEQADENILTPIITENLIPFFQNHLLTLQSVKISILDEFPLKMFYEIFLQSNKIQVLMFNCTGNMHIYLEGIDWSVLRSLSTLKRFKVKFSYKDEVLYRYFQQRNILAGEDNADPQNEENEEIVAQQDDDMEIEEIISPIWNDWNLVLKSLPCSMEYISLCDFQYIGNPGDITSVTISSVGKFENLRVLSMEKCSDFFNDDTLQFICKTLTKLRKLKGEFQNVTDYGINGLKEDGSDSGVSLKNLKGLQKLVIYSGSGSSQDNKLCFTWAGLLRSVAFLELTRLKIMGSLKDAHRDGRKPDSKDGHNYLKLVQQNPSLNEIGLSFYTPINWFHEQASKLNRRIKTINVNAFI